MTGVAGARLGSLPRHPVARAGEAANAVRQPDHIEIEQQAERKPAEAKLRQTLRLM